MVNHPLTDEMCKELSVYPIEEFAAQIADGTMTDMRAAADWQLEQVKKKVKSNLKVWRRSGYCAGADAVEDFFEEIMFKLRPQENN